MCRWSARPVSAVNEHNSSRVRFSNTSISECASSVLFLLFFFFLTVNIENANPCPGPQLPFHGVPCLAQIWNPVQFGCVCGGSMPCLPPGCKPRQGKHRRPVTWIPDKQGTAVLSKPMSLVELRFDFSWTLVRKSKWREIPRKCMLLFYPQSIQP